MAAVTLESTAVRNAMVTEGANRVRVFVTAGGEGLSVKQWVVQVNLSIAVNSKAHYPRVHLIFKMATRTLGRTEYSNWRPISLERNIIMTKQNVSTQTSVSSLGFNPYKTQKYAHIGTRTQFR